MPLSKQQKKYIKKNLQKDGLKKVAHDLGVNPKSILDFLKKRWPETKYQKFLNKNQLEIKNKVKAKTREDLACSSSNSLKAKLASFNFKDWLKANRLVLIFLSLLVFAVYGNSLANGFVADDLPTIVKDYKLGELSHAFRDFPVFVRPLLYFFTYKAFAVNPIFYRLGNVLFHVGTVLALYLFLFLLFNLEIAFLAAILFAVHPVLTESITWISGGIYVVYSFFIIFSLLFYLLAKGKTTVPDKICFEKIKTLSLPANLFKNKFYNLSLVSFFLALASSEKAMVLPFLLFLLEISFFKIKKNWRKLILPFLIGATWILFYAIKIPQRRADLSYTKEAGIYNPLLQLPMSISSYLELIFFPKNLTFYHSELNINYFEYAVMLSIIITLIILIFISFKKNKALFFCLSFFIIALLPVLTPFGISWIVAERYLYLASIGMISAFVLFVYYLTNLKKFKKFKEALYLFFALTVFLLSARTILRNQDWQNQDKLWLATAKLSPSSPQNRNNLGDYYGRQGDFERSIFEFKMAIKLAPNYAAAYHNLANTYLEIGEFDLAIENYYQSLKLDPNFWQTYKSLARAYFRQGKYDLAEQHLLKAIEFDPENPDLPKDLLFLRQQKQEASKLEEKSK